MLDPIALNSHIISIPPADLQECTFLCLTPCKCMDFAEAFGVLSFVFPCSQLFNWQHHLLAQQDLPAARVHIWGLNCADKLLYAMARSCFSDSRSRWAGRKNEAFVAHIPLCLLGDATRISFASSILQKGGREKGNPSLFIKAVKGQYPDHRQSPVCKSHSISKSRCWCWRYQTQYPLWGSNIPPLLVPSNLLCCTILFLCCSSLLSSTSRS